MNLIAKRVVFLVNDGVDESDLHAARRAIEREGGEVFLTTGQPQLLIETINNDHRGKDVLIDIPIETVTVECFDALVIPEGAESVDSICAMENCTQLVRDFYVAGKVIVFSGAARQVGLEQGVSGEGVLASKPRQVAGLVDFLARTSSPITSTHKIRREQSRLERVV